MATFHAATQQYLKVLEINSINNYINGGVVLMNLVKMRQDEIENKFIHFLGKKAKNEEFLICPDQEAINSVCYGKIRLLPCRYNVVIVIEDFMKAHLDGYVYKKFTPTLCYKDGEWEEACGNPAIIHYAGPEKPWINRKTRLASNWTESAEKNSFIPNLVEKCATKYVEIEAFNKFY